VVGILNKGGVKKSTEMYGIQLTSELNPGLATYSYDYAESPEWKQAT